MALQVKKPNRTAPQEELADAKGTVEEVEGATAQATKTPTESKAEQAEPEVEQTEVEEDAGQEAAGEPEADEPQHDEQEVEQPKAQATQTAASTSTAVQTANNTQVGQVQAKRTGKAAENYFKQMIEELAESGQEGLEMGFGVFPMISLDKGEFKLGDEDVGRDDFEGVPLTSKPKYAYRTTGVPEKEAEVVFCDSDKEHLDPNSAVSARLLEWKEKNPDSSWEVKQYQDVFMYLTRFPAKPEMEGQLVQLSVAPTSVKRYTRACLTVKGKGREAHECVFRVAVGEKVRGEYDYYPWDFSAIGSCQKLGVVVKFGGIIDEDF